MFDKTVGQNANTWLGLEYGDKYIIILYLDDRIIK